MSGLEQSVELGAAGACAPREFVPNDTESPMKFIVKPASQQAARPPYITMCWKCSEDPRACGDTI